MTYIHTTIHDTGTIKEAHTPKDTHRIHTHIPKKKKNKREYQTTNLVL